jgi:DNA sulfur modification protein DndD
MLLERIDITNFRQYHGIQSAEFATDLQRNVTVFHGLNGAGKSSLFAAINWCLYAAAVDGIGELINKQAIQNTADGDSVVADVTVYFRHEDRRYTAKRQLFGVRSGNACTNQETTFTLVRFNANGNSETVQNPIAVMNSVLASNVRPYFFFDGERMEDLTKAGNEEVREAVRNVMRLPMLERAEEHLGWVASEYRREIKRQGSGELERLVSEEDELRAKKQYCVRRKEEIRTEIVFARQRVEELSQRLRDSDGAKALQQRRDEINRTLSVWERQQKDLTRDIQQAVNRSYHRYLAVPAQSALSVLDQKRERGEIPSGVREQVIRDLLDAHICICGRRFSEGDSTYDHLHARLKTTSTKQMETETNTLAASIRALSLAAEGQKSALETSCRLREDGKAEIERLYLQKSDVDHELRDATSDDIASLERLRSDIQAKLERNIANQAANDRTIADIDAKIADVQRQKKLAEDKEQKVLLLGRSEELAQKAADAVTKLREEFFEDTRKNIEASTKQVFSRLAWKQEHFQDVQIDENFRIEVTDRWGTPTRKELSAGERQILSLSFICAMSNLSGEEAPLVMDTPFGRLSGNHLAAVAESLPSLTKQLILFVTDREWDEASRTNIEPRAGRQYCLNFDRSSGCTQIVEVDN